MRRALPAFALLALAACGPATTEPLDPPEPTPAPLPPPKEPAQTVVTPPTVAPPVDDGILREVVYVFMRDRVGGRWMCTGTLVSPTTAVTAAHCLDPAMFEGYTIVAPLAPNTPRVRATSPRIFGGTYEDVANPDIGVLTLDTPIQLPAYAQLTDVVARVEGGDAVSAAAIVRTSEEAEAPLEQTETMPVTSTVQYGYEHGFGTPMFSKGGDSGAGLFLVENGKITHKLIGVARQPEPDRGPDHFTRIDAAFLQWFD